MAKKLVRKKRPSKKKSEIVEINCNDNSCRSSKCGGIYGLGIIGSAIYFVSTAGSFWSGVLGILKSLVWPAFMVYELFKFLLGA